MVKESTEVRLAQLITKFKKEILDDWMKEQIAAINLGPKLMDEADLREESSEFLKNLCDAMQSKNLTDVEAPEWAETTEMLQRISDSRAEQGFSATEMATFILLCKQPVFKYIQKEFAEEPETVGDYIWSITILLDKLSLYITERYVQTREDMIQRQQEELLELSTPVVQLWDRVVAVPLIGTLDSTRSQMIMENLLERIIETDAAIAIIDVTGVPTIDTLVAQHLMKTVSATRLMGADCILSGIRPQVAQTIVHMGVELGDVITKATLADAFAVALQRLDLTVGQRRKGQDPSEKR